MSAVSNNWHVKRENGGINGPRPKDEFSRVYGFSERLRPDGDVMLGIVCAFESAGLVIGSGHDGHSNLSINRHLDIYLSPLRLSHETEFVLKLFTVDKSSGGSFEVRASPVVGTDSVLLAKYGKGRRDSAAILDVLMLGKDITFELAHQGESLLLLHLENDFEFKRLSEETYKRFAELEFGYEKARSRSDVQRGTLGRRHRQPLAVRHLDEGHQNPILPRIRTSN